MRFEPRISERFFQFFYPEETLQIFENQIPKCLQPERNESMEKKFILLSKVEHLASSHPFPSKGLQKQIFFLWNL